MNKLITKLVKDIEVEFSNNNIKAITNLEVINVDGDVEYKIYVKTKDKYICVSILDSLLIDEYYTTNVLPFIHIDMVLNFKINITEKICKDLKEKLNDDNIEVECFNRETDEGEPVWEIVIFNIHSNNLIKSFDISENYLTDEYYIEKVLPTILNDIVKVITGE